MVNPISEDSFYKGKFKVFTGQYDLGLLILKSAFDVPVELSI